MTTTNTSKTTKITLRYEPCNCGCKGTDPWHARTVKRVVRDSQDANFGGGQHGERGCIRMPWGTQPVKRLLYVATSGASVWGAWEKDVTPRR